MAGRCHGVGRTARIVCAVHFAHAADADSIANSVSTEARARERAVHGTQDTRFRQRDRWSAHKSFARTVTILSERMDVVPCGRGNAGQLDTEFM